MCRPNQKANSTENIVLSMVDEITGESLVSQLLRCLDQKKSELILNISNSLMRTG